MSQEKSNGMNPAQLVANWRKLRDATKDLLKDTSEQYSEYHYIKGLVESLDAAADGLELEIKRSNYVSGKEATEENLIKEIFAKIPKLYRSEAEDLAQFMLSKYRVIER